MHGTAYWWHDRLAIFAHNVAEGHLRALVRICLDLWVIHIRDLVYWDCMLLVAASERTQGDVLLS